MPKSCRIFQALSKLQRFTRHSWTVWGKRCGYTLCMLLVLGRPTLATEAGGSNYLPGFYGDFGMAVFPKSGTYFSNFLAAYRDISEQTGTLLEMPSLLHVSEQSFWGAHYVSGFFPALLFIQDDVNDLARVALGDFYIVPAGLHWQFNSISLFLFEGIVAPTGHYQINDFNTGRNYWTFDHNLLLTWDLTHNNEISVALGVMNNLENPATNYRSGDELHFDFNLGHYWGNFALGMAGAYYAQLNSDHIPSGSTSIGMAEATSIGPSILVISHLNNAEIALSLKWLYELDVSGRSRQEYLVARVQVPF